MSFADDSELNPKFLFPSQSTISHRVGNMNLKRYKFAETFT